MKLSQTERTAISKKNQQLEDVKPILKKEFIGIDHVIDQIVDSIRPYFIFPKSLKRPLVANLFGMTGTGKTHLVERLVDILNLKHKYFKFDVGDYAKESSDWKMKSDLSNNIKKTEDKDLIIVFDEFQLGRTIDEKGLEVDRSALRPMWELIDSGIITTSANYSSYGSTFDAYAKLKKCLREGVKVENGIITEGLDIYWSITEDDKRPDWVCPINFAEVIPLPKKEEVKKSKSKKKRDEEEEEEYGSDELKSEVTEDNEYNSYKYDPLRFRQPYFINYSMFRAFYGSNPDVFANQKDYKKWRHLFCIPTGQLMPFISESFIQNSPLMVKSDYSQSLIFVIGNIDEAYMMTHSSDPDADPDIFYEHSLKITVPKMKDALSARYRMEQIGRLGNNMIIYPAISGDSYKKIIEKHLVLRQEYFENDFGIKVEFTDGLRDILYKEAVFPTQGVRPVLSTFNSFIDSYISKLIGNILVNDIDAQEITWDFIDENIENVDPNHVIDVDGNIFKYPVKLHIEQLRKSDNSENQLYTAVHEAGHAIMSIVVQGLIPKVVMSKTASAAEGFCRTEQPETTTKDLMYGSILVALGGRAAELAIFGDKNLSNGAGSDLEKATTMAVTMIKYFGMGNKSSYHVQSSSLSAGVHSEKWANDAEQEAIVIFNKAEAETKALVAKHLDKIIELSDMLSTNSKIEYDELKKLVVKWNLPVKDKDNYHNFKEVFKPQVRIDQAMAAAKVLIELKTNQKL